jgi:nitrosocyanin
MNKKLLLGLGILLAVILAALFLAVQGGLKMSKIDPTPEPTSGALENSVKEISVESDEFKFAPETITAKKGDKIKITFTNKGSFSHNFSIPDFGLESRTITRNESDAIEFTADRVGTFRIICTVTGHENLGMTGTLTITE